MSAKEEFIEIYRENIRRDGADALLDYLENKSDFFTAPASARFHGAYAGGLCEHSVNVYHCLAEYLARERAGADKMELEKYTLGSLRRAVFDGDVDTGSLMAGQVAGMLHEIRPLRAIFEDLWTGYQSCVKGLTER